ncbi:MAG TPA: hypothetical protein VHZ09_10800 [Acidobacteriaceae bacterium]|jgi:hypothetical protein|nr:hypothetical protein [Acidobacteriaceae bacterium]
MAMRGKVLQAGAGQGLITVNGQQYSFATTVWQSAAPAAAGMTVDVELGADGSVKRVTPVAEGQIAKEQAEAVMNAARQKGGAVASAAVAKFGIPLLAATGLMLVAWFFLSAVSVATPFSKISFTFWQVLGFVNASNAWDAVMSGGGSAPSAGIYGLLAIVALAGPFLRFFWRDKRAALAGLLPLVFLLFVALMVRSSLSSALGGTADGPLAEVQQQAQQAIMSALSVGIGSYLSLLVSAYLGWVSVQQFLSARSAPLKAVQPATPTNV